MHLPGNSSLSLALAILVACLVPPMARAADEAGLAAEKGQAGEPPTPPLLDENGVPFPPARPAPQPFNAEIAASRFAELAMADALLEMEMGELVRRQGSAAAVRDLGHRMLTNHTAIRLILSKAAAGSVDALPTVLDAERQQVLERLRAFSGPDLDREYLWEQTLRQPRTTAMYRWQYENCDDPKLKQFAVGTMPIVVVHARLCDEAHRRVNAADIAVQEKRAAAERKAEQERRQAEAQAAAETAAKKSQRKFKK